MALTLNYLAQTLWNRPIYGVLVAPFIVCCRNVTEMIEALEAYEGTIVWVETKRVKGIDQGYYKRVAPRPDWLRAYLPDSCGRDICHRDCTQCADKKYMSK